MSQYGTVCGHGFSSVVPLVCEAASITERDYPVAAASWRV